ncbi:hypothetical protein FKZ61_020605 [Litorilinea aerophila]|uniref:Uncharacterized protein n=1 Tax=Litorilinea aerophila TaxID=1204385 RepID=A0A540VC30_9CHLR|nr:hypothetical protein [Litorilinea aerophila]MCC9078505.1 hypothetical protein [Litorilinea aerophila]OUC06340.1 hypothetical protein RY27_21675 [Litorilinea aerophila]GIV80361.1 MAG: hypothetical protein KatS3mg050_4755 [Litorilinea sp.]
MFTHPHVAAAVFQSRHEDLLREAQRDALIRLSQGERPGVWRRFGRLLARRLAWIGQGPRGFPTRPASRAATSSWPRT